MGHELKAGRIKRGMMEYDKLVIVIDEIGGKAVLCIIASTKVNLGMVRFQIKKLEPYFEKVLEQF